MRRTDRLFELVQILRDGRLHRAADLAQTLDGVSVRTIWRDMATLIASGMPIEGERGVGYILRVPTTLPPLMLTPPEMEALRHGVHLAARDPDPGRARAARSLAAKIAAVAPAPVEAGQDEGGQDEEDEDDLFTFAPAKAAPAEAHVPILRAALRDGAALVVIWLDAQDRLRREILTPLRLEIVARRRRLVAIRANGAEARSIWLDRVQSLAYAEPAGPTAVT